MAPSQKIIPWLWFDSNAEEAANFYTSLFPDSRIGNILHHGTEGQEITGKEPGTVMTIEFELAGYRFTALNGGPYVTFTPAISFWVQCETTAEVDALWAKLIEGGTALMPLDKYDWSEKYGWVQDKFGLTWQIGLGKLADVGQKITPFLMYVGPQHGRAEAALRLYTDVFADSQVDGIWHYGAEEGDSAGAVKHAQFALSREKFMALDGGAGHAFNFNEAISLEIRCTTQSEVDYFWDKLTADGGEEGSCGWLKDKFGVSWQVVPQVLYEMLSNPDAAKTARVSRAIFQMEKLDIDMLQRAYAGVAT
jgi:predicted 3-demethylubiquinone-9 3-methyltransferase (glyoxalase superfamily)